MRIEISEDNGFLLGGIPSLVVVTVHLDSGKSVRFPYVADKSISALYEDLLRVNTTNIPAMELRPENQSPMVMRFTQVSEETPSEVVKTNEIEKEDIVTCVKVEDRGEGATTDIRLGGQYRVIKVHGKSLTLGDGQIKNVVDGYDVIDDNAPVGFRMYVFAHEVVLARKRKAAPKKFMTKEVDLKCSKCGETVYCGLKDGSYTGKCECGSEVSQSKVQWDIEHPMPGTRAAA